MGLTSPARTGNTQNFSPAGSKIPLWKKGNMTLSSATQRGKKKKSAVGL